MATRVPFLDLKRIHEPLTADILKRIESIIGRSAFVLGPEVGAFETEFAAFVESKHAVGVSSGLDALKLALQALDIGPGDEVITAANTFIATVFAITSVGATPVLVDCEKETYNLDPVLFEKAITARTKAVIPVHLYGLPATMGPILEIAARKNIVVIEDVAQAHGARYKGKSCGTFGKVGCFSFYPGKNLGAMGEGGAITTDDEALRDRIRMFRDVGQKSKYNHEVIGSNARLHTFQAAVLSAKLPGLAAQNEDRARVAKRYRELLSGNSKVVLPKIPSDRTHVFHLFVVSVPDRDGLQKFLADQGVQTGIHYPVPPHLQKCYAHLGIGAGRFPVTEALARSALSLPMFPKMTDEEIEIVAGGVNAFYNRAGS